MQDEANREQLRLHIYMPGLDVLRGLAVASVVFFHAFANSGYGHGRHALMVFVRLAELGKLGVYLFFTLSGFLITSILLKQRSQPDYYKNFYIRRALRILPAYLLLLVVLKAFGVVHWPFVAACLLFIANMAKLLHSNANEYGVLWTLAVEEQFYLLWPTVVHKLRNPRALLAALAAGCVIAPVLRFAMTLHGLSTYLLLPTNMDVLLYGALCAVLLSTGAIHRGNLQRILNTLLAVGLVSFPFFAYFQCFYRGPNRLLWACLDAFARFSPYCLFLVGILWAVRAAQQPLRRDPGILWRAFTFLGYISYGLYLVHTLLFALYDHLAQGTSLGSARTNFLLLLLRFVVVSLASVAVATLSRRYYEQLFLGRKKALAPYAGTSSIRKSA